MSMILLVDVGNSNIVFGFAKDRKIVKTFRLKTFILLFGVLCS